MNIGKERNERFQDYAGFVEKFKPKKTTDDCYTPPEVYETVLRFVRKIADTSERPIVRPFYPGGDYENCVYPENCIVVDNPPFSIYSQIVRFYLDKGIDFFLFAPHLTLFVASADCAYVVTYADITYENGAKVKTSFVTSLLRDLRVWACPELKREIEMAQKAARPSKKLSVYKYPDNFFTSASLGRIIAGGVELKVRRDECVRLSNLDSLRRIGKSVFGGGFLISELKAAELKAAELRAANVIDLSEHERDIVKGLGRGLGREKT